MQLLRAGLILLLCGAPALAQIRLPTLMGIWNPVPGAGAIYDVVASDGSHSTLDLSMVGTDGNGAWLEILTHTGDQDIIIKELIGPDGVRQVVAKMTGKPAVVMPPEAVVGGGIVNAHKGRLVSHEFLTVDHVKYPCDRYRMVDGSHTQWDVWVSGQAAPCNLVLLRSNRLTMSLTKVYKDAHTRITETPQPMELP